MDGDDSVRMMSSWSNSSLGAHGIFVILMHSFIIHFNEPRLEKTAQLVSYVVQFLSFLNLIFYASSRLLRLYNTICDGPGRKPQSRQVFSRRGDGFKNYTVHVCIHVLF